MSGEAEGAAAASLATDGAGLLVVEAGLRTLGSILQGGSA